MMIDNFLSSQDGERLVPMDKKVLRHFLVSLKLLLNMIKKRLIRLRDRNENEWISFEGIMRTVCEIKVYKSYHDDT